MSSRRLHLCAEPLTIREQIIQKEHDIDTAGHFGPDTGPMHCAVLSTRHSAVTEAFRAMNPDLALEHYSISMIACCRQKLQCWHLPGFLRFETLQKDLIRCVLFMQAQSIALVQCD